MPPILIKEIYVYPVKGAKGISRRTAGVDDKGLVGDRRFMVVDEETGMFVTQRSDHGQGVGLPKMCLIQTSFKESDTVLRLRVPGQPLFEIPLAGDDHWLVDVQIWDSRLQAYDQGNAAGKWITQFLSETRPGSYRLVRMSDNAVRKTNRGNAQVAFSDGYPILGISEESLLDLNKRMGQSILMNRFRPNMVFAGGEPYCEDRMGRVRIGNVLLDGVKLCTRCTVTLHDQLTGEQGHEPLRTLAKYRKRSKGVVFGMNFNHLCLGYISVGDVVEVLKWDDITE